MDEILNVMNGINLIILDDRIETIFIRQIT